MAEQVNLSEAMQALRSFYGDSFADGFEDGKDDMTGTLEERMRLSKHEARQVVEALVAARMVRWEGTVDSIPAAEGTVSGGAIIEGTWLL